LREKLLLPAFPSIRGEFSFDARKPPLCGRFALGGRGTEFRRLPFTGFPTDRGELSLAPWAFAIPPLCGALAFGGRGTLCAIPDVARPFDRFGPCTLRLASCPGPLLVRKDGLPFGRTTLFCAIAGEFILPGTLLRLTTGRAKLRDGATVDARPAFAPRTAPRFGEIPTVRATGTLRIWLGFKCTAVRSTDNPL